MCQEYILKQPQDRPPQSSKTFEKLPVYSSHDEAEAGRESTGVMVPWGQDGLVSAQGKGLVRSRRREPRLQLGASASWLDRRG